MAAATGSLRYGFFFGKKIRDRDRDRDLGTRALQARRAGRERERAVRPRGPLGRKGVRAASTNGAAALWQDCDYAGGRDAVLGSRAF